MKMFTGAILLGLSMLPGFVSARNANDNVSADALCASVSAVRTPGDASEEVGGTIVLPYAIPEIPRVTPPLVLPDDEPDARVDYRSSIAEQLADFAATLLGRKYVWGATGPRTFDCSGFTGYVFRKAGIELPRTSRMQYSEGERVERANLQAGDLMFFSSPRSGRGKVGHVGMVVSVDESSESVVFIHASTKKGITYQKFPDGGYFSRNYIGAKRVIPEDNIG